MDIERTNILLSKRGIIDPILLDEINSYLDFTDSSKPVVKVISGEERLKAKAMEAFANISDANFEFFCTAKDTVNYKELLLSDYIIVYTAAMKIAPMQLTAVLRRLSGLNKRAFIVVDKWDMLPCTVENMERVRNSANSEFAMLNILATIMVNIKEEKGFYRLDGCSNNVKDRIKQDYYDTHLVQINKLYMYYIAELKDEYVAITEKANGVRIRLEEIKQNLLGIHKASNVRFGSIHAELSLYSRVIFEKISNLSADECLDNVELEDLRLVIQRCASSYTEYIMKIFDDTTKQVIDVYKVKSDTFRKTCINSMYQLEDKLTKLAFVDFDLLSDFNQRIEELDTVDIIIEDIQQILSDGLEMLRKKVAVISKSVFREGMLDNGIKEKIKKTFDGVSETDENAHGEKEIKKELIIKKRINEVIKQCNLQVFSEIDIFVSKIKKDVTVKSENIVGRYYIELEQIITKLESETEKRYVIK